MSQIATSIEQSKLLIAAGLDPESADMMHVANFPFIKEFDAERVEWLSIGNKKKRGHWNIPAWSLSALWQMVYELDKTYEFTTVLSADELIETLVRTIIFRRENK